MESKVQIESKGTGMTAVLGNDHAGPSQQREREREDGEENDGRQTKKQTKSADLLYLVGLLMGRTGRV